MSDLSLRRFNDGFSFLREEKGQSVMFAILSGFCLTLYSYLYQGGGNSILLLRDLGYI